MFKKENIKFLLFSITSVIVGVISTYLLSNYFSINDFGKLQFLLTLIGIGSILNMSGYDITIQKEIFKKNDNFVKYVLQKVMPFPFFVLIVVALVYAYIESEFDMVLLFALIIVLIGLFDKSNAILNSKLLFKPLRYFELFTKVTLLILALGIIFLKYSLEIYFIFFTIIHVLIFSFRIFYSHNLLINVNGKKGINKKLNKEGIKNTLSASYGNLTNWSERLILGLLDLNLLAIFVIGQLFSKTVKDNVRVFLIPTLNLWAKKGFNYYSRMIKKYSQVFWIMGIVMFIFILFLVEILINNFFIKYHESILIAQLLSITLIFKFVENIKMSSIALSKHTHIYNKINNITNTLKIILVICLIPLLKIYGAVISILFVECIRYILISIEYSRLIKGIKK